MAVAMKVLLAAFLVRVASADHDANCTEAFNTYQGSVLSECDAMGPTCGTACTEGLENVLTLCEGKKFENATGDVVEFEKVTYVAAFAILVSDACKAAAIDVALAGGRCNAEDCALATGLLGSASVFDCQTDAQNPEAECPAQCVAAMDAAHKRCMSDNAAAGQAIAGATLFLSTKCREVLNGCLYGVGCGSESGTTTEAPASTEAPSSSTTAENPSEPEICPKPPPSTTGTVSFSARAAVLPLFAVAPVVAVFA